MVLTYTIETDGRQADANQHMVLTHIIETDGRRPHNRNIWSHNSQAAAFCHTWPILLFGVVDPFIPLTSVCTFACRLRVKVCMHCCIHTFSLIRCILIRENLCLYPTD